MEISLVSQGKKPQHMWYKSGFWYAVSNQVSHPELRVKSMGMDNSDRKVQLFMIQLQRENLTKTIEWEQLFSKKACRFQRGPKRRFFLTRLLFYLIIIGRIDHSPIITA